MKSTLFGPSKEEIALAQQIAQLTEALAQAKTSAEYNRQRCQELEAQLQTEQKESQNARIAAHTAQEQVVSLRVNLERIMGESPFVRIERRLILFTDVKEILGDEDGNLSEINGRNCFSFAVSAQDLERLVSAHYHRRAQPPQE
jgi:hypothetical protein